MTLISGLGPAGALRGPAPRAGGSGFTMASPGAAGPGGVAAPAAMPGLLAMQEAMQDLGQGAVRDREARRHGAALLAALAELQRALLGNGEEGGLERLAILVRQAPVPADPALASIQRAVLVRAAIELARRAAPCGTAATVEKPFETGV